MKKKDNNKKDNKKSMGFGFCSFEPPKLELTDKKIKAIKTIMDDPMLRYKDSSELKALIEGYEAAKDNKKGDKK